MRGQDGEFNSLFRKDIQGFQVYGGFRKPHPLGFPAKAVLKISNSPAHLGNFVRAISQRHDNMVIGLGQG